MRQTRLSSGVVVVKPTADGWRYLLLRAYNDWDFPKGEVEPGEDPLAAAQREVTEETGITRLHFHWGEIFCETEPYRGGRKIARYYLAQTDQNIGTLPLNPVLGRAEHHEYRWADDHEARHLLAPRLRPILDWAATRLSHGAP